MAYFTYIDGKLQYERKDSSSINHTVCRRYDSELELIYRVAFYPNIGAYIAWVVVDNDVHAKAECYWETSND